jgi:hypothetical protein
MKKILEGLQILSKYFPNGDFHGEHDQVWAGGELDEIEISKEDKERLEELGWFIDEESYSHFC